MSVPLVEAAGLSRRFGDRVAVDEVTFTVAAGEIVALLGPNGAGKTTTLRMVAGLIAPSGGRVRVDGPVGLLTEAPGLWERLTVQLNLLTYARLHGVPDPLSRVADVLALVGLADRAQDPAVQLSKGLKQRAAIARALLHEPRVVLLDEPTSGLDPSSARGVRDLILDLRRQGRAVLVCTHNLAEAESLADRVAILKTRLLALDSPRALRRRMAGSHVEIDFSGDAAPFVAAARAGGATDIAARGHHLTVHLGDTATVPDLVNALVAAGGRIERVAPDRRTLEEAYLHLVEGDEA
jgi:ABC-2 type transport system ATP-binding protein